jgi:methanogenic corrinoid protein MtbC1
MARGGPRTGAGRKKGQATKMNEAARRAALETGISPLDFLLNAMRDATHEFDTRLDAAKAAAPYVHARLAAITHSGDEDNPVRTVNVIERRIVDPKH